MVSYSYVIYYNYLKRYHIILMLHNKRVKYVFAKVIYSLFTIIVLT